MYAKYQFQNNIPLFFILYIFTNYLSKYLGYSWQILGTLFFFLGFSPRKKIYYPLSFKLIFFLLIYLFFGSLFALEPATTLKTVLSTATIFFMGLYIFIYKNGHIYNYLSIINFFSFIFTFITILSVITPDTYTEYILKYLPVSIRTEALRFHIHGVSAGITNQTGINAWFSVIGLAISFSSFISQKKIVHLLLGLLYFTAIILTAKRAHLLFSLLVMMITYIKISKKKGTAIFFICLILMCIILYCVFLFPDFFNNLMYRSLSGEVDVSSGRFNLWKMALDIFYKYPLLGCGFGNFSLITGTNVHNVYLQFLCETGIIGFILFCSFIVLNLRNMMRVLSDKNSQKNTEFLFSAFIILFFSIYCLTGNCFNDLEILLLYFTAVCVIEKKLHNNRRKNNVYPCSWKKLSF